MASASRPDAGEMPPESERDQIRRNIEAVLETKHIPCRRINMNRDRIAGNWKQASGKVKEHWGRFIDDQFVVVAGKRDQLAGQNQTQHGVVEDAAESQRKTWEKRYRQLFEAHRKPETSR